MTTNGHVHYVYTGKLMLLPAATMCINVQKPGVPDLVELKKSALCVVYRVVEVSCNILYT